MSLFITSLASGSNGNCYYIGNSKEAVLIDAGISCREIETRMKRLGLSLQTVKAVFISHEHSDHIQGLPVLVKKHKLPVYITADTARHGKLRLAEPPVYSFRCSEPVKVGSLTITPFSKAHDAADPHSFVIAGNGVNVGVFTDIGVPCTRLIRHFSQCHAAFLESNYDEQLLAQGSYPAHLKARIRGGKGHLSNRQALELFKTHRGANLSHLLLAHLSKNNNCPKLVKNLFQLHAGSTEIVVASRYEQTPVYHIQHTGTTAIRPHYFAAASQLQFSF
jgi:phosphoribosyl 1,2-cyclic phosphodiesterase